MTDTAATPNQADAPPPDPNAVNITINGRPHVARKGQLLIEAAADAGEYIPRFCYHDRMAPVRDRPGEEAGSAAELEHAPAAQICDHAVALAHAAARPAVGRHHRGEPHPGRLHADL